MILTVTKLEKTDTTPLKKNWQSHRISRLLSHRNFSIYGSFGATWTHVL